MNEEMAKDAETFGVELAAGGLVFSGEGADARVAVVHRPKHQDWVLPKGRRNTGEALDAAALREAQEETGERASLGPLAGSYAYTKNGKPKTVLVWRMSRIAEPYSPRAPQQEVDEVAWLSPEEAVQRLNYDAEKDLVVRHCLATARAPAGSRDEDPAKGSRLAAAINSVRDSLTRLTKLAAPNADLWWARDAARSLGQAHESLLRYDLDVGWGSLHDAERVMVFGMSDTELLARAESLKAEMKSKLKGWRGDATTALFAPLDLAAWRKDSALITADRRALLRHAVSEGLFVLHDDSNNRYHRLHLVGGQLSILVRWCFGLLVAVLLLAWWLAPPNSAFALAVLAPAMLAGALGGVVSAMYQLSRVGQTKIPEALLQGLITSGRPLVGAASALFIYAVLQSKVISLLAVETTTLWPSLVLGFIAGFSESFVLGAVAKVASGDSEKKSGDAGK